MSNIFNKSLLLKNMGKHEITQMLKTVSIQSIHLQVLFHPWHPSSVCDPPPTVPVKCTGHQACLAPSGQSRTSYLCCLTFDVHKTWVPWSPLKSSGSKISFRSHPTIFFFFFCTSDFFNYIYIFYYNTLFNIS